MIRTPGDFVCFLHEKTLSTNQEPGSPQTHLPDLDLRLPIFACPVYEAPGRKEKGTRAQGKGVEIRLPTVQPVHECDFEPCKYFT